METLCSSLLNSHKTALLRKCSVWPSPSKKRNSKFHLMRAFAQQATLLHNKTKSEFWRENSWILKWTRFYVKWMFVYLEHQKIGFFWQYLRLWIYFLVILWHFWSLSFTNIAILTDFEALNSDFAIFQVLKKGKKSPKSKFRASNIAKKLFLIF